MSEILLLSSGLDSFVSWHFLGKPPALHITGHSRYSKPELRYVLLMKQFHPEMNLRIIDIGSWLKEFEEPDANLVARNSLFCHIAAYYADTIFLPCQLGEQSIPDRNPENLRVLANTLSVFYGKPKEINIVFPNRTKQGIVKLYLEQGLSHKELTEITYSCMSGRSTRCGECGMCARTSIALEYNGIETKGLFKKNIWKWSGWGNYVNKLKKGEYEPTRTREWIEVLKKRGIWK